MSHFDFESFKGECIEGLSVLQKNLENDFDINWYENWFYDQATGLLTFSTKDVQINFRYVSVGTYSRNTNTWKWSWDNESLENVKSRISEIKNFGKENHIEDLTTGQFDATEQNGWEFTAIAAKLLNGIGAYRPVDEHLLIFMVLMEFVDEETAQSIKDRYVSCGDHGSKRAAFVCQHLNTNTKTGFEEAFDSFPDMELDDDNHFQAWCSQCEAERIKEGEWTDEAMEFAKIRLVCVDCYFEIKEFNVGHE